MAQNTYPHKILIIEDETPMLDALVDNLQAVGFNHIIQATNGEEGLALALKEHPDLILLDIVLPKMDGMTMLKKLREQPEGQKMKVILLTNLAPDDSITKQVVTGEPAYYLIKADHSINDVIQKVKDALAIGETQAK